MPKRNSLWGNIDWVTVSLFLVLVFLGWINIYAAVYNDQHQNILDISQQYGKQLIWIGAALILAFTILIIESNFYVLFSYIIYGFLIFLLILVLFVGKEVNGAKSWFGIGTFGIQPSEFCKFATALALARYMSSYGFKLEKFKSIVVISLIILMPAAFIVIQNDTGSALVYLSFVLVLYREGLSGVVLFFGTLVAILFILALVISNFVLSLVLLGLVLAAYLIFNPKYKIFFRVAAIYIGSTLIFLAADLILNMKYEIASAINAGLILGSVVALVYSLRKRISNFAIISLVFLGSVLFTISVDYAFNNLLESHHRERINELLGISSNPLGAGWNVNQSKIAIGSGGFLGKGFLKGTQTKFDFVPAQSTDFIFCTVGEEWGFLGTFVIVALFIFSVDQANLARRATAFSFLTYLRLFSCCNFVFSFYD